MLLEGEASVDVCLGYVMSGGGKDDRLVYSIVDYAVMYRLRHLAEVLSLAHPVAHSLASFYSVPL